MSLSFDCFSWCLDLMFGSEDLNLLLDHKTIQILEDGSDATEP
jgi:hypothetical protein